MYPDNFAHLCAQNVCKGLIGDVTHSLHSIRHWQRPRQNDEAAWAFTLGSNFFHQVIILHTATLPCRHPPGSNCCPPVHGSVTDDRVKLFRVKPCTCSGHQEKICNTRKLLRFHCEVVSHGILAHSGSCASVSTELGSCVSDIDSTPSIGLQDQPTWT